MRAITFLVCYQGHNIARPDGQGTAVALFGPIESIRVVGQLPYPFDLFIFAEAVEEPGEEPASHRFRVEMRAAGHENLTLLDVTKEKLDPILPSVPPIYSLGWSARPTFTQTGAFVVELYIDNVLVASRPFSVEPPKDA